MSKIIDMLSPKLYLEYIKKKNHKDVKLFHDLIKENKKYKNIHKGQRCFILGSGPSVNDIDFGLLKNEITFTVNQLVRNNQFEKLQTDYHMWADRIFFEIDKDNDEDVEMLDTIRLVNIKSPKAEVFYEIMAKQMIDDFKLEKDNNINYFQSLGMNTEHIGRKIIDFSEPVPNYPTVVHSAIILAVYMGFKEIYLLGCDCTGIINIAQNKMQEANKNLYAFEMTNAAAKRLERYAQQRSIKDELYSQAIMFEKYEEINRYCVNNGVKLYNATRGGLLDSIERVDLEKVIKCK